jgi:hypothetical protein
MLHETVFITQLYSRKSCRITTGMSYSNRRSFTLVKVIFVTRSVIIRSVSRKRNICEFIRREHHD